MLIGFSVFMMFALITACAPNKGMTRDRYGDKRGYDRDKSDRDDEDFRYSEKDGESSEDYEYGKGEGDEDSGRDKKAYKKVKSRPQKERRYKSSADEDKFFDEDKGGDSEDSDSPSKERFDQTGLASWYGREFHGRLTASGERFNMNEYTAAHKTYPFGTILLVKNLDNGKKIKVRINDRGPYKEGRIIDLSYASARKLDIMKRGQAMVGIVVLKKGDGERKSSRKYKSGDDVEPVAGDEEPMGEDSGFQEDKGGKYEGKYSLQAGAFHSKSNATNLKKKLEKMFDNPVIVIREGDMYKVRVEAVKSRSTANRYKKMLEDEDIKSFVMENSKE